MPDSITVIREEERPVVDFPGGATYRTIIGDDTGDGLPIRTGIQTSQPGYQTRVHSHPYVETLTVIAGVRRSLARWRAGHRCPGTRRHGRVAGEPTARLPRRRRSAARHLRHPYVRQAHRQLQ